MAGEPLVPVDFAVPEVADLAEFRLELLGPQHNEADHAAWTTSIAHIRATPGFGGVWPPPDGMTLAENLADLQSHERRSAQRVDFAYSVLDRADGETVGCVYFTPSKTAPGEVIAKSWVTAARAGLDGELTEAVGAWLRHAWPFEVVRYRLGLYPTTIRKSPSR